MFVFTSAADAAFFRASLVLAAICSVAAVPAVALALGWVDRRLAGAAPGHGARAAGGILLALGTAGGFVAARLAHPHPLYFLLASLCAVGGFALVAVGVVMLASSGGLAALRAVPAPAAPPPAARGVFGVALVVGGASLALDVLGAAALLRSTPLPSWWPAGGAGELVPMVSLGALPPLLVWAVGRAAMVAGAAGLAWARYAGTLVYTAGFALAVAPRHGWPVASGGWSFLALDVAALALAWRYVRPAPSPAASSGAPRWVAPPR